jgi:translocation and assembly module TamB
VVGSSVAFVLAAAGGAILHLGTGPARRVASAVASDVASKTLAGTVQVERLDHLSVFGLGGARVRIDDPRGETVLIVDVDSVRVRTPSIVWSLLFGSGPLDVPVERAHVAHVEAKVVEGPSGVLTLQEAVTPVDDEPKEEEPPGRGVRVRLDDVRLDHLWAHGAVGGNVVDAEVRGLAASGQIHPERFDGKLGETTLIARGVAAKELTVTTEGEIAWPTEDASARRARATVRAAAGAVRATLDARVEGEAIDARLEVPRVSGEDVRAVAPVAPLYAPVSLVAQASGTLAAPRADLDARVGDGRIHATANARLEPTRKVDANVEIDGLDPTAFSPTAPSGPIHATARASLQQGEDEKLSGTFALATRETALGGTPIPAVDAQGRLEDDHAEATVDVHEPGAPVRLAVDAKPHPTRPEAGMVVDFSLSSEAKEVSRVRFLEGVPVRGAARVSASGRASLVDSTVDAQAFVELAGVRHPQASVGRATVNAKVTGSFAAPIVDVAASASDVNAQGVRVSSIDVTAAGKVDEPHVTLRAEGPDIPRVRLETDVVTRDATGVRHTTMTATRDDVTMRLSVDEAALRGDTVVVRSLSVDGLGEPLRVDATVSRQELRAKATAPFVDLARVTRLVGRPDLDLRGSVVLDTDIRARRTGAVGHVRLDVEDAAMGEIRDVNAAVDFTLEGRRVRGDVRTAVGEVGWFTVAVPSIEIDGDPRDARAWANAWGKVTFRANATLANLQERLPADMVAFGRMGGVVGAKGTIERARGQNPDGFIAVWSEQLELIGKSVVTESPRGEQALTKPPFRLVGSDYRFVATVSGQTGDTEIATHGWDKDGIFVGVNAKARLPLTELRARPEDARALLERAPMNVRIEVPKRRLDALPDFIGRQPFDGDVEASIALSGTVADPRAEVVAHARGVRSRTEAEMPSIDADVTVAYDSVHADARLLVQHEGNRVIALEGVAVVPFDGLLRGGEDAKLEAIDGSVWVHRLPLRALPGVGARDVSGEVTGKVALTGVGRDAKLEGRLDIDGLSVGDALYKHAFVDVRAEGGDARAQLRIEQADGHADVEVRAPVVWGAELAPALDETRPVEANYDIERLRLSALRPFVAPAVTDIDGLLEGRGHIVLEPGKRGGDVEGTIALRNGTIEIAGFGEALHNIQAAVRVDREGTVHVETLRAETMTGGRVDVTGAVETEGLAPTTARFEVRIPERHPFPVAFEGQPLGAVWGDIDVRANNAAARLDVDVDIPRFEMVLPRAVPRGLQSLDYDPTIVIGHKTPSGRFMPVALGPPAASDADDAPREGKPMRIAVNLGREIRIERGTMLSVTLTGNPVINVADQTRVQGEIVLRSGRLEVQGKRFVVESGTITMNEEDVGNPTVVATARWDAPDGTRVYADFVGPVKTGELTLRSEPAYTQSEILTLLLFGAVDGRVGASANPRSNTATGQQRTAATAASVAGGVVSEGLNAALNDITSIDVSTRVGTNESNNPRPEVAVQVANNITATVGYNIGPPAPGRMPDQTILMLDFHFFRRWSATTTFGNRGSTLLDLTWNYRY